MNAQNAIFDSIVFEAVYTDKVLTKADYRNLDRISKIAMDIYESGDIQEIRKGVQALPQIYEKTPEKLKPTCRILIDKCDAVLSNLEILEKEFEHKGDLKGYNKNMVLNQIVQVIGTVIIITLSSLLQIEIPFITAGGSLYNGYFIGKKMMRDAKDMDVYKAYSKLKNEDPLTIVRNNIQNLNLIRRNLTMILNSND